MMNERMLLSSSLMRSKYDHPLPSTPLSRYSSTKKKENPLLRKSQLSENELDQFFDKLSSPKYKPRKKVKVFNAIGFGQHYRSPTLEKRIQRNTSKKKKIKRETMHYQMYFGSLDLRIRQVF